MKGGLRPLSTALGQWSPGGKATIDPLHAVAASWAAIVGADVAAHSTPLDISGKTLLIATKSSAWSQQLHFLGDSILARVRGLGAGAEIERLAFRVGSMANRAPGGARSAKGERRVRPRAKPADVEPAADLESAFRRLRERMLAASRAARGGRCPDCGAAVEIADARRCAPCAGRAESDRAVALERIVYMAPWLTLAELREQLPELSGSEFEHARRRLLQRWWLLLDRARRAGRVSPSGAERHVASSYVLLHSRLPPDRITPAVVRNLLGEDLEALLWPSRPAAPGVGHADAFVE